MRDLNYSPLPLPPPHGVKMRDLTVACGGGSEILSEYYEKTKLKEVVVCSTEITSIGGCSSSQELSYDLAAALHSSVSRYVPKEFKYLNNRRVFVPSSSVDQSIGIARLVEDLKNCEIRERK